MKLDVAETGIDWLDFVPSQWKICRTKTLFGFESGWTPDTKNAAYYQGENPWANISDLKTPLLLVTAKSISDSAIADTGMKPVPEGRLLFSFKLSIGLVALTGKPMFTNEAIAAFDSRMKCPKYWLFAAPVFISKVAKENIYGAQLLNRELIRNAVVVSPPLSEQRRIAAWLDLQTTRIDKRRELLTKKRELLRDLRSNLVGETLASGLYGQETTPTGLVDLPALPVGWQASHTKRLLRFITSGSRGWAEYYAEQGDIFLRIGNLTRETIDLDVSDLKYVALPAKAAEGKRTRLRPGDMLVSITADLGSIAVVPVLDKPAYVSQHIALCRPKDGVHPRWLGYAMVSPQAKRQLMSSGYGGTKIQLSLDDVRNVWQAVPPLDEQIEIADFLDQRLSKIARQITLIDQLDELLKQQRKAIIHEAVTGKIDLSAVSLEKVET